MIVTKLHKGQGLGNQLWSYVVTRVIARKRGLTFGIKSPEVFLGKDFMNLDFGETVKNITHNYTEKHMSHPVTGADISLYDSELINISDNTEIAGVMQDENYILDYKNEIREWLKIKNINTSEFEGDDICILNFRGGEYTRHPELYLSKKYWDDALAHMRTINPDFKFAIITDDVSAAKQMLPEIPAYHFDIGKDYAIVANAKYLILSNSSFAWFPAWLNPNLKYCIAPKYWARHNVSDGYWSTGSNLTRGFMYQDRDGILFYYEACLAEHKEYIAKHPDYFIPRKQNLVSSIKNIIRKFI